MQEKETKILGLKIIYREMLPNNDNTKKNDILLLHGQKFSSETWQEIKTYEYFSNRGHRVVGVDLPSGNKSKSQKSNIDPKKFIIEFIKQLNIKSPIVVSPSMSGIYSIPLLSTNIISGLVWVAAVTKKYSNSDVPVLLIYGSQDQTGRQNAIKLHNTLTNSKIIEIGIQHPCYLDDPKLFHETIESFISTNLAL